MAADHEFHVLASQADKAEADVRRRKAELLAFRRAASDRRETIRAYQRLFLDPEGDLNADAMRVIADFSERAELGRADPVQASDAEMRERAGMRKLALHILHRLDLNGHQLRKLAKQARETDNE